MSEVFRSQFRSYEDEFSGQGKRPVVFDILGPDGETSLLPDSLKLVLHVNPSSMKIAYTKTIERIQTRGGWVEQHWGDATQTISFDFATGGFMRLYSGLSNITNPTYGGTRRETIAYDRYLDLLALFQNNASVYDLKGEIVFQGRIKITFDGGIYLGWFNSFTVEESAEKPFQFSLTAAFDVDQEIVVFRSAFSNSDQASLADVRPPSFEDIANSG
jgi:hypothetical protein